MHGGEGGIITTTDDAVADRLRLLRNQGMRVRYQYEMAGHNWRLTDLQAAIAVPQLATAGRRRRPRGPRTPPRSPRAWPGVPGLVTPVAPAGPHARVAPVHGAA